MLLVSSSIDVLLLRYHVSVVLSGCDMFDSVKLYTGQDVTLRIAKSTPTSATCTNLHLGHKFVHTAGSMDTRLSIAMHTTR